MIQRESSSFTLIEMIGAMAILSVAAAILAPNIVRQIQTAKAAGEDQNLNTIANGVLDFVNSTQNLPSTNVDSTTWASELSKFTALSTDKILYVFPGQSFSRRVLLYDPDFLTWGDLSTNVWSTNAKPNPARVMLVSSSSADTSLTITGLTSADFTYLFNWNKIYSNGVVDVPTGVNLSAAWQKKGEFLHVKTINLSQNFCQVSFRDCYAPIANITGGSGGTGYTNQSQFIFTNQGSIYQVNCDTNIGTVTYVSLISAAGFNDIDTFQTTITIPGGTNTFTNQPPPRGVVVYNNITNNLSSQPFTNIILKGTKIYLQGTQTYEIQNESEFEFFNQTWTQKF
jgi:type II secretory pathway pseudopilin PulG